MGTDDPGTGQIEWEILDDLAPAIHHRAVLGERQVDIVEQPSDHPGVVATIKAYELTQGRVIWHKGKVSVKLMYLQEACERWLNGQRFEVRL